MITVLLIHLSISSHSLVPYVIQFGGRGEVGVSQKMTKDNRGVGGGQAKDDR